MIHIRIIIPSLMDVLSATKAVFHSNFTATVVGCCYALYMKV